LKVAKRNRTIAGRARRALLLKQITPDEYVRIAFWHPDWRKHMWINGSVLSAIVRGRPRVVRTLVTGTQ